MEAHTHSTYRTIVPLLIALTTTEGMVLVLVLHQIHLVVATVIKTVDMTLKAKTKTKTKASLIKILIHKESKI